MISAVKNHPGDAKNHGKKLADYRAANSVRMKNQSLCFLGNNLLVAGQTSNTCTSDRVITAFDDVGGPATSPHICTNTSFLFLYRISLQHVHFIMVHCICTLEKPHTKLTNLVFLQKQTLRHQLHALLCEAKRCRLQIQTQSRHIFHIRWIHDTVDAQAFCEVSADS